MLLNTVALFLLMKGHPDSASKLSDVVNLRLVGIYSDVATCTKVVDEVKADDLKNPVEPLLGDLLKCVVVYYAPKTVDAEPVGLEPVETEHDADAVIVPKLVPCKPRYILGDEVACNKEA